MAKRTDYRVFYSISRARAALRDAQAARRQLGEQAKLSGRHGRRMSCATPLTLTPSKQAPPCRSYSWTWATETPPCYAPATSTWQASPAPWQRPTGPSPPPPSCNKTKRLLQGECKSHNSIKENISAKCLLPPRPRACQHKFNIQHSRFNPAPGGPEAGRRCFTLAALSQFLRFPGYTRQSSRLSLLLWWFWGCLSYCLMPAPAAPCRRGGALIITL